MERISRLLSEALTPYRVTVGTSGSNGKCLLTLRNSAGEQVLQRTFGLSQFADLRSLTDVADGLHRDLLIAEGRLEPCMIAALESAARGGNFSVRL